MLRAIRESRRDDEGTILLHEASSEDEKAIALFDEILRQEGNRDVFVTRPFAQGRQARNGLSFMGDGSSYYGVDPDSDSD
ncbi:hypothetical protein FRC03_011254 [Tulasnella sp. 419]|nr:hypothetical protein FRC03_011254 [Tulasnella sp. 419]